MSGHRKARFGIARLFAACLALFAVASAAIAQPAPVGILAPGDSAVTGFSGALAPLQIPPGTDPAERTFIDLNGPSVRVIDLGNMPGEPQAQLVNAPKPYTFLAGQVGQVFAVALDNVVPPNVYVAATSSYGLPIVTQGPDGQLRHIRTGTPGAGFMPGLWGAAAPNGGAGSIWKIDGVTGAVTLFANVTLNGRPNSGASLGGLAFDPVGNTLFAADRETGLIHRLDMSGAEISRYDHGMQGRPAMGLPPVAFDPAKRLDITNPAFDSRQPATWNYAAPERRVFGLGIRSGRLYYSVADGLQIWSISIAGDALDPVLEFGIPPSTGPTEISKIEFDEQGRMILGERPDPTGAFDFKALTQEGVGRVLRYGIFETYPGVPRVWQPEPSDYAIGFPPPATNGNGGVAIGLDYDRLGYLDAWSCGGFLWSTGERLRKAQDPALIARLQQSGPLNVDGLQGNRLWMVRPQNTPPLQSYFIDYDDRFEDEVARGHMGDIAIWRVCGPMLRGGWMLPWWTVWWTDAPGPLPPPPNLSCPVGQQKPGYQCCPKGTTPGAGGQCKPYCPNGLMDPKSQKICGLGFDNATYDPNNPAKLKCIGGSAPAPGKGVLGCIDKSPVFNPPVCQAGWSKQQVGNNTVCQPTKQQLQCPVGQQVSNIDGKCHTLCLNGTAWPSKQCCAPGSAVTGTGQCCPVGSTVNPKTGQCSKEIVFNVCPKGVQPDPKTGECPQSPPGSGSSCPPGSTPDPVTGGCKKTVSTCLPGLSPDPVTGECKTPPSKISCAAAQLSKDGACCPAGSSPNGVLGGCCPAGQSASASGVCKITTVCAAPNKQIFGKCCSPNDLKSGGACAATICKDGKIPTGASNACCDANHAYTDKNGAAACCANRLVDGQCQAGGGGQTALPGCAVGYKQAGGSCCLESQITSGGQCCPAGQSPSGANKNQCAPTLTGTPPTGGGTGTGGSSGGTPGGGQCCMTGLIPAASGVCCAASQVTSMGVCCPAGQTPDPKNRKACVPTISCGIREVNVNGACCAQSKVYSDTAGNKQCCPQDVNQQTGTCAPLNVIITPACAAGYTKMPDGSCCVNNQVSSDGKYCGIMIQDQRGPDCSARGPLFIRDLRNPKACVSCGGGRVPNAERTACLPAGQPQYAPQYTPPYVPPSPPQQQMRPQQLPPPQLQVRPPQQQLQVRPPTPQIQVRPPQPQIQLRPTPPVRRCIVVRGQNVCQ